MKSLLRFLKWFGISLICLIAGYAVFVWLGSLVSLGVLETATHQGDVVVALSSTPQAKQALLATCLSSPVPFIPGASPFASELLTRVPSGTRVNIQATGGDVSIETMTVVEGQLRGHQVWACRGQFALLHQRFLVTALEDARNNLSTITALGQLLIAFTMALMTTYVYFYTRRNNKLAFFYNNWNKQQDVNIQCLIHDDVLRVVETLVYGEDHEFDINRARSFTFAFLHLNKIQNNYEAMKEGVLSKREYLEMSLPTLRLFARNKRMIVYLVSQRGYGDEFRDSIVECLRDLEPFNVPPLSSSDPNPSNVDLFSECQESNSSRSNKRRVEVTRPKAWRATMTAFPSLFAPVVVVARMCVNPFTASHRAAAQTRTSNSTISRESSNPSQSSAEHVQRMTSRFTSAPSNRFLSNSHFVNTIRQLEGRSVEWLYRNLNWLINSKMFYYLSFSFVLNPILLGIQLYRAVNTANTTGLSATMFIGFAFLNIVTGLAGLRIKNSPMVLSCAASFVIALLIGAVTMK